MDFSLKGIKYSLDQIQFDGNTNHNWSVEVEYNALPEKRIIIASLTYKNISNSDKILKLAGYLKNPQVTYRLDWTQVTPETGICTAVYRSDLGYGAIETGSSDNKAFLVLGFNREVHSYSVTASDEEQAWKQYGIFNGSDEIRDAAADNQYLSHSFENIAAGQSVSLSMVIAICNTQESTVFDFLDTIYNLPMCMQEAEEYWSARWEAAKFEIRTPEPAIIDRMSEIAMINVILSHDPVNKAWMTSCGSSFRGVTFV